MRRWLLLLVLLTLAGCAAPPVRYKTVPVTVTKMVSVPPELTKPCPKALPQNDTVAEAVSVANARGVCVDILNGQLEQIRSLGNQSGQ